MQTVLFIDDDSIYNLIHRQLAEKTAFAKHILISVSPVSALVLIQELSRMKTIPLPEVIFLDLMMPLMDGFGFLDEFEKLPEYLIQRMKIIILTSSLNEDDFSRAKKYKSVINIIKKPLLLNKMLEIKEELEKYQVNN